MARHQKSLLEAFQRANDERAGGDPASAGPFAGTPTSELQTAESRNLLPSISSRDSRVLIAFAGWGLLTFVIGVLAGRQFSSSESLANETETSLNEAITTGSAIWTGSDLTPGEEVNEALDDAKNRFTILAFSCPESELDSLWEHYYNLGNLGLPVGDPIMKTDTETDEVTLYLVVGAETKMVDLAGLEAFLHSAGGPGGASYAYSEAYVLSIDSVLDR